MPDLAYDVAVGSSHAYVADNQSGLRVVSLANPDSPVIVGGLGASGFVQAIAVREPLACFVDQSSGTLRVVDVSDPTTPVQVGSLDVGGVLPDIALAGSLAYVTRIATGSGGGLRVIDLSVPSAPQVIGSLSVGGSCVAVAVGGSIACVANEGLGLRIVDVSVPTSPLLLATVSGQAEGAFVDGELVYVAAGGAGLRIVDISDPSLPQTLAVLPLPGYATGVSVHAGRAYVAARDQGVHEVDVSNPAAPLLVGSTPTLDDASAVANFGSSVCVAAMSAGLRVIDPADPPQSTPLLPMNGGGDVVTVANGIAYVGVDYQYLTSDIRLVLVDTEGPGAPIQLGSLSNLMGHFTEIAVAGNFAYLPLTREYGGGLQIVDVSDPMNPRRAGSIYPPWYDFPGGIEVSGNLAFVAASDHGLWIVDVTNPSVPTTKTVFSVSSSVFDVDIEGRYAYLLCADALKVVDVINPLAPVILSSVPLPEWPYRLLVQHGRAYIIGSFGLRVFDLANPVSPQFLYSLPDASGLALARKDNFLYLASGTEGLKTVDIGGPDPGALVGDATAVEDARSVAVTGTSVILVDAVGVRMMPLQCPHSAVDDNADISAIQNLRCEPNPLRDHAAISLSLARESEVRIDIFDSTGRRVRTLLEGRRQPGSLTLSWDGASSHGRPLPTGVYRIRCHAGGEERVISVILLR